MRTKALLTCSALLLAAACDAPNVEEYEPRTGLITGTILYPRPDPAGPCADDLVGDVIITLFAKDALPPPEGTSGPVNFIVVAEETLFDGEPDNGIYTAPFTIPTVPEGTYQIRAFIDADEDFHPTIAELGQTTAGDVGGGHVDTVTGEFLDVEVKTDQVTSQVTVSLGRIIPTERPVFVHGSTTTFSVPFTTPQPLVLTTHGIDRPSVQVDRRCNQFLVGYADLDDDGAPDDVNGDHLPDLFPQVLLRLEKTETETRDVIIPGIIDPLPFMDALSVVPAVPTSTLTVLLPPVAVQLVDGARQILPRIPTGRYETIVIQSTGQTWQVPNRIDVVAPTGGPDPTQSVWVQMQAGPEPPAGGLRGTVRVQTETPGDVFVVVFDASDPPPPAGTGGPLGLASVPMAAFDGPGAMRSAPFEIRGLPDGAYLVSALLDADGDFSAIVDLLAQPSAGDFLGGAAAPVAVQGGFTEGVQVVVGQELRVDRPAFSFDAGTTFARTDFPASLRLSAHEIPALGIDAEGAAVPVVLSEGDQEGDNFTDLLPRVLLTRMVDEGDPRRAANDPRGIVIPALVDPIPFYGPLLEGVDVLSPAYDVILPPVAVELSTGQRLAPPPAGRYRVNVLSATGQTWSVPNPLDVAFARVGTPREDPSQARFVTVEDTPLPAGGITGAVQLTFEPPADDFSVVVFAFALDDPPPPLGGGSPRAVSVIRKQDFGSPTSAAYALGPLPTGTYTVRAFLDANDDFTAWFDVLNQPDGGDVGGGFLDAQGGFQTVTVDAALGATVDIPVIIDSAGTYPTNRPSFQVNGPAPVLSSSSVAVSLTALAEVEDVAVLQGVFPIQWVDLNRDGVAEDVNGDGNPDVFPLVVADLLDEDDASNQTLAAPGVRIPGLVDPRQFVGLGFPAMDPTATSTVVPTNSLRVVFPALAVRDGAPIAPVPGRYRITLVNPFGQTWSVPNRLAEATGSRYVDTQGVFLTVPE